MKVIKKHDPHYGEIGVSLGPMLTPFIIETQEGKQEFTSFIEFDENYRKGIITIEFSDGESNYNINDVELVYNDRLYGVIVYPNGLYDHSNIVHLDERFIPEQLVGCWRNWFRKINKAVYIPTGFYNTTLAPIRYDEDDPDWDKEAFPDWYDYCRDQLEAVGFRMAIVTLKIV